MTIKLVVRAITTRVWCALRDQLWVCAREGIEASACEGRARQGADVVQLPVGVKVQCKCPGVVALGDSVGGVLDAHCGEVAPGNALQRDGIVDSALAVSVVIVAKAPLATTSDDLAIVAMQTPLKPHGKRDVGHAQRLSVR